MNSKMMASGAVLVFLAMAMPSNAYHVNDDLSAANGSGLEPLEWGAQAGATVYYPAALSPDPTGQVCALIQSLIDSPLTDASVDAVLLEVKNLLCGPDGCFFEPCLEEGDVLFSFGNVVCEQEASGLGDPGNSGAGGLCFMNPGFTDAAGTADCAFVGSATNQGNSNGFYNPYATPTAGVEACNAENVAQPVIQDVGRKWYEITMQSTHPVVSKTTNQVSFTGQIGGISCGSSTSFVYDEQFAYTTDSGHVAGFPDTAPSQGQYGGYWVTGGASPAGMTACAPYPMYY